MGHQPRARPQLRVRATALVKRVQGMTHVRFVGGGKYLAAGRDRNLLILQVPAKHNGAWTPMRRFLLEDDIRAIISAPDSNRLMIHTEGGVEVRDFARVVGLAPPVEQLFKCSFDLDYTRRILSDYKYLLFKSRPLTGRTFVQNCVLETRHEHLRQALFISPDAALVENDSGTAFEIAIDHKDRTAVKLLLDAVVRSSQPSARAPFVRSLPTLIDSFPDLVSHFLQELGLEDAETFTRFAYVDQEQKYEGSVDQMARTL